MPDLTLFPRLLYRGAGKSPKDWLTVQTTEALKTALTAGWRVESVRAEAGAPAATPPISEDKPQRPAWRRHRPGNA